MMTGKYLIVGLGNPGGKYAKTRHNVGFWVVNELARRHGFGAERSEKRAQARDGSIQRARVKLAKPQTFMNRSGESVRALVDYYDIPLERLLVIHDDLDTPFGSIRLRKSGGHGGQNGLRSIIQHLGSQDYARLRFGIGRPPGRMSPVDFVLQPFKGDAAIQAQEMVGRAADAVECWLVDGIEVAMSRFNGDGLPANQALSAEELKAQLSVALRAQELSPRDPKPLSKVIALQKKLGCMDEAVRSHLQLATLYEALDKGALANAERIKAVTMQPSLVDVQRQIADWFLSKDNKKKAVARYLILAQHLQQTEQPAAALEALERAFTLNPQHPKAQKMRAALPKTTDKESKT